MSLKFEPQGHSRENTLRVNPSAIFIVAGKGGKIKGEEMETVKEIQGRQYETDSEGYRDYDSGCYIASRYLGKASRCLKCPFGKCILDIHRQGRVRKDQIKQLVTSKIKEVRYGSIA